MHNVINDSLQSGFSGLKAPPFQIRKTFGNQKSPWKELEVGKFYCVRINNSAHH